MKPTLKVLQAVLIDTPLVIFGLAALACVGLVLLPLLGLVTIVSAITDAYDRLELRLIYGGDEQARARDRWKLT